MELLRLNHLGLLLLRSRRAWRHVHLLLHGIELVVVVGVLNVSETLLPILALVVVYCQKPFKVARSGGEVWDGLATWDSR